MVVSEIERGKIRCERRLVLEAAQIEDLRAVVDTSNHRNGKTSKRGSKTFKSATCAALRMRSDRQTSAWHGFERQCAGTDLARTRDDFNREPAGELRGDDRQQPLR